MDWPVHANVSPSLITYMSEMNSSVNMNTYKRYLFWTVFREGTTIFI